jgi:hypothetical protein
MYNLLVSVFMSYCKRPNVGQNMSAPEYIKEAPKYIKSGYNHPEEEVGPAGEKTPPSTRARVV